MTQNGANSAPRDAFEGFREMRDAYLDTMSKAMIDLVNSEAYTKVTGSMLEGYLSWATPFRESLDTIMRQSLEQMSLPSRQEVAVLAERFTQVEMRLDDLDAKLGGLDSKLDSKLDRIAQSLSELLAKDTTATSSNSMEQAVASHGNAAPAAKRVIAKKSAAFHKESVGKE